MIGRVISDYRIIEYVGRGSMGDVYKAQHTRIRSLFVAIKFIPEDMLADARAKERFVRQAEALAAINHPGICRFYQMGETEEGRTYIIMSYCDGGTFQPFIARGQCPVKEAVKIGIAIADGLSHAHAQGVIHRDLKPANLMFHKGEVQIVDFGLALLTERSHLTGSEATVGTLLYTSPEQAEGTSVDGRADMFSFGSVLYEMLTGTAPFSAEHAASVLYKIVNMAHRPIREARPDIPQSLAHVVDRCLAKKPSDRYENAAALRVDLEAVQAEIEPTRQTTSTYWIKQRRRRILRAAVAALAVLVVVTVWQRCWLIRTLGLGYCSGEPGIVVLPVETAGASPEESALAAGLARDLTNRIRAHRGANPSAWTVAPDRARFVAVKDPENARGRLGVRLAITARPAQREGHDTIELQSFDVRSSADARDRRVVDAAGRFDSNAIGAALRDLARLKPVATADSGYTRSAAAYHDYLMGLGHLESGNAETDPAAVALEAAVSADTSFARARAALGEAYQRRYQATGDTTWAVLAARTCRAAIASLPEQTDAYLTLARVHASRERTELAIETLEQALAVDPRCRDALWQLAGIHDAEGRRRDAEAAYIRAVDTNRGDPTTYEMLGWIYLSGGEPREAIAPLTRVSRLIPQYGNTFNYLGSCYFQLDCWEGAIEMFTRSFDLGRNFAACANLGTLYYLLEHDYARAAQMYQWARELNPRSPDVVLALGDCHYWSEGGRELAFALFREAAEMTEAIRVARPTTAHYPALLAGIYALIEPDSMESCMQAALTLGPEDADVHFRAAVAYDLAGQREKALTHLARAIDLGQSMRQIDAEPFLAELRKDARYQDILRKSARPPQPPCPRIH